MSVSKTSFRQTPRATLSAGCSADFCQKISLIAETLGITRNKLILMSIDAGLESAIAQARAQGATADQHQGGESLS